MNSDHLLYYDHKYLVFNVFSGIVIYERPEKVGGSTEP